MIKLLPHPQDCFHRERCLLKPQFDSWRFTCRPMTMNKVMIDQMNIQSPLQTSRRFGIDVRASSKGTVATTGGGILPPLAWVF
ncbi:hypothetical protein [Candidatus Magnetaquiglobus chichijimensis]|uniref:hypothetical protein n=1 Tax=Candidatus Magnetaquiglobus chichijimensis TaxID=3141448 RepID=UPI003B9775E6